MRKTFEEDDSGESERRPGQQIANQIWKSDMWLEFLLGEVYLFRCEDEEEEGGGEGGGGEN